jgi:hypothetical protein
VDATSLCAGLLVLDVDDHDRVALEDRLECFLVDDACLLETNGCLEGGYGANGTGDAADDER